MHFQYVASCVAAFLLAALTPALVFGGLNLSLQITTLAFVVSLGHAVLLGLPLFFLFQKKRWTNVFASIAGGFVVGAIPFAFFTWPFSPGSGSSYSFNNVPMIINGIPTPAGWVSYGKGVASFGCYGALAGLVFWLVLKSSGSMSPEADRDPRRMTHWGIATALAAVAVLLSGVVVAIPSITKDRTCHNLFRDRGSTIGTSVRIYLPVADDDWSKLKKTLEDFSAKRGMSVRDFAPKGSEPAWGLDLSLCDDRGTVLRVDQNHWSSHEFGSPITGRGIGIFVYETRANSGWQTFARDLASELESAWPGKVQFRGDAGRIIPNPRELGGADR